MLTFEIWTEYRVYLEEPEQSKMVSAFYFFQEALDYVREIRRRGWKKQIVIVTHNGNINNSRIV